MKSQFKRGQFSLTENEVAKLYNAASNFQNRLLIKTLYYTGLRRFEIAALRIPDLDIQKGRLTVRAGKGNKMRVVPLLNNDLLNELRLYTGDRKEGPIFSKDNNKPLSLSGINWIVAQTGHKAQLKNPNPAQKEINPHLLRHSISRHLKNWGYPAEFIQNFLGHASIKTTMDTYGTMGIDQMQSIIAQRSGVNHEAIE